MEFALVIGVSVCCLDVIFPLTDAYSITVVSGTSRLIYVRALK